MCNVLSVAVVLIYLFVAPGKGQRGLWMRHNSFEFFISPASMVKDYNESLSYCKEHGGSLAIINNDDIQGFLTVKLDESNSKHVLESPFSFFIGLRGATGKWKWENGTPLEFNLLVGDNDTVIPCITLGSQTSYDPYMHWERFECFNKAGFVCQRWLTGEWSDWSGWSHCSSSCIQGVSNRQRTCNKLDFKEGYSLCQGQFNETRACNINLCMKWNANMTACDGNGTIPSACLPTTVAPTTTPTPDYTIALSPSTANYVPTAIIKQNSTSNHTGGAEQQQFTSSMPFYVIVAVGSASVLIMLTIFGVTYHKKYILKVTDPKTVMPRQVRAKKRMSTMEPIDVRLDGFEDKERTLKKYNEVIIEEDEDVGIPNESYLPEP